MNYFYEVELSVKQILKFLQYLEFFWSTTQFEYTLEKAWDFYSLCRRIVSC
jgi:hypothetical protein